MRHLMEWANSRTTAEAIAVPSNVAVPRPTERNHHVNIVPVIMQAKHYHRNSALIAPLHHIVFLPRNIHQKKDAIKLISQEDFLTLRSSCFRDVSYFFLTRFLDALKIIEIIES